MKNCEGTLKKAGRCLFVNGVNYDAFTSTSTFNCKLTLKRLTVNEATRTLEPREFMRIADRRTTNNGADLGNLINDIGQRLRQRRDNDAPSLLVNLPNEVNLNVRPEDIHIAERNYEIYTRNLRRRMNQRLRAALDTYRLSPTEGEEREGENSSRSSSSGPSSGSSVSDPPPPRAPARALQGRTNRRRRGRRFPR